MSISRSTFLVRHFDKIRLYIHTIIAYDPMHSLPGGRTEGGAFSGIQTFMGQSVILMP